MPHALVFDAVGSTHSSSFHIGKKNRHLSVCCHGLKCERPNRGSVTVRTSMQIVAKSSPMTGVNLNPWPKHLTR